MAAQPAAAVDVERPGIDVIPHSAAAVLVYTAERHIRYHRDSMLGDAPRLATEVSARPGVEIFVWPEAAVTVDDNGFGVEGGAKVAWSDVVRIARGQRVHRFARAGSDFWAFRTKASNDGYWVRTANLWTSPFSREVRRRFAVGDAPPLKHWQDRDFSIRAYVVWPSANLGEPLYVPVRRHWWSWRSRLAYNDPARGER